MVRQRSIASIATAVGDEQTGDAALRAYRYPNGGGEHPHKDGVHDHPVDALRYYFVNVQPSEVVRVKRY